MQKNIYFSEQMCYNIYVIKIKKIIYKAGIFIFKENSTIYSIIFLKYHYI